METAEQFEIRRLEAKLKEAQARIVEFEGFASEVLENTSGDPLEQYLLDEAKRLLGGE